MIIETGLLEYTRVSYKHKKMRKGRHFSYYYGIHEASYTMKAVIKRECASVLDVAKKVKWFETWYAQRNCNCLFIENEPVDTRDEV
jgi:hypothetical protein